MSAKKKKGGPESHSILNRKARFEYHIDEEMEAGLVLQGSEVKSLREGKANIQDAYAIVKGEELWLLNSYIAEYTGANRFNHEPRRLRKLLLHKKEIRKLIGTLRTRGTTVIPLKLYFNSRGMAKLMIGVARGKKLYDKRQTEKQRDWQREKAQALKKSL